MDWTRFMKSAICRRVCREIEEAEPANVLSDRALEHFRSCAECQSFLEQRVKLSELLGTLVPIEAPKDFDLRLRARLANRAERPLLFRLELISFGFRPVVLATMLFLVGAALFWRFYQQPSATPAREVVSENLSQHEGSRKVEPPAEGAGLAIESDQTSPTEVQRIESTAKPLRNTVALGKRVRPTVSKDFGSVPARVLKSEQPVAQNTAVFPIEAPYQPLKFSLTDGNGVPRTISVPAVSFGSQRVLFGSGATPIQSSVKGDW